MSTGFVILKSSYRKSSFLERIQICDSNHFFTENWICDSIPFDVVHVFVITMNIDLEIRFPDPGVPPHKQSRLPLPRKKILKCHEKGRKGKFCLILPSKHFALTTALGYSSQSNFTSRMR